MADLATSSDSSLDMQRLCLTAVDEVLLTLLAKRLARALLLDAEANIDTEPAPVRLDSVQPDSHS